MAINILDSMIINRISAGEVVESPFSIVKELLDNSLDAGATRIIVEIKNGGIDLISIKDNGHGIEKDDIIKAFLPHATSKIKNIEDLEAIATLGFRGEALASISNVSQTSMITKTQENDLAYAIDVFGGDFSEIMPSTIDCGTKIEVKNLFFNTPARKKFLRKPKQEENQITNILARYILAHPSIYFKYIVDGKIIYQTTGKTLKYAIYCVYGAELTDNIVPINKEQGNLKLSGYVSKIGFSKPNTTYQTLMINSRFVVDEIVSKAAFMAFEEYLMPRQFPFYVLNLELPSVDVDVNVHPSKMTVKFENPSAIYDLVYTSIRASIFEQLNPQVEIKMEPVKPAEKLIKTDLSSLQEISVEPTIAPIEKSVVFHQEAYSPISIFNLPKEEVKEENHKQVVRFEPENKAEETHLQDVSSFSDFKIIGQLFNEFIILEKDSTMILLDFHAGHERLNYDKFCKMVEERNIVIQDLLIPYTQTLSNLEIDFVLSLKDELFSLGFDIELFGDNQIIINSIPMQLKDINLKSFVDDMLHDMKNLKPSLNNEIKHYLMQKACKSSVKSGMTLTEFEIKELLKDLDMKHPVLLCPHGRPVISVVTKSQIEKWFKRIV